MASITTAVAVAEKLKIVNDEIDKINAQLKTTDEYKKVTLQHRHKYLNKLKAYIDEKNMSLFYPEKLVTHDIRGVYYDLARLFLPEYVRKNPHLKKVMPQRIDDNFDTKKHQLNALKEKYILDNAKFDNVDKAKQCLFFAKWYLSFCKSKQSFYEEKIELPKQEKVDAFWWPNETKKDNLSDEFKLVDNILYRRSDATKIFQMLPMTIQDYFVICNNEIAYDTLDKVISEKARLSQEFIINMLDKNVNVSKYDTELKYDYLSDIGIDGNFIYVTKVHDSGNSKFVDESHVEIDGVKVEMKLESDPKSSVIVDIKINKHSILTSKQIYIDIATIKEESEKKLNKFKEEEVQFEIQRKGEIQKKDENIKKLEEEKNKLKSLFDEIKYDPQKYTDIQFTEKKNLIDDEIKKEESNITYLTNELENIEKKKHASKNSRIEELKSIIENYNSQYQDVNEKHNNTIGEIYKLKPEAETSSEKKKELKLKEDERRTFITIMDVLNRDIQEAKIELHKLEEETGKPKTKVILQEELYIEEKQKQATRTQQPPVKQGVQPPVKQGVQPQVQGVQPPVQGVQPPVQPLVNIKQEFKTMTNFYTYKDTTHDLDRYALKIGDGYYDEYRSLITDAKPESYKHVDIFQYGDNLLSLGYLAVFNIYPSKAIEGTKEIYKLFRHFSSHINVIDYNDNMLYIYYKANDTQNYLNSGISKSKIYLWSMYCLNSFGYLWVTNNDECKKLIGDELHSKVSATVNDIIENLKMYIDDVKYMRKQVDITETTRKFDLRFENIWIANTNDENVDISKSIDDFSRHSISIMGNIKILGAMLRSFGIHNNILKKFCTLDTYKFAKILKLFDDDKADIAKEFEEIMKNDFSYLAYCNEIVNYQTKEEFINDLRNQLYILANLIYKKPDAIAGYNKLASLIDSKLKGDIELEIKALKPIMENGQNLSYCYSTNSMLFFKGRHWDEGITVKDETGNVVQPPSKPFDGEWICFDFTDYKYHIPALLVCALSGMRNKVKGDKVKGQFVNAVKLIDIFKEDLKYDSMQGLITGKAMYDYIKQTTIMKYLYVIQNLGAFGTLFYNIADVDDHTMKLLRDASTQVIDYQYFANLKDPYSNEDLLFYYTLHKHKVESKWLETMRNLSKNCSGFVGYIFDYAAEEKVLPLTAAANLLGISQTRFDIIVSSIKKSFDDKYGLGDHMAKIERLYSYQNHNFQLETFLICEMILYYQFRENKTNFDDDLKLKIYDLLYLMKEIFELTDSADYKALMEEYKKNGIEYNKTENLFKTAVIESTKLPEPESKTNSRFDSI